VGYATIFIKLHINGKYPIIEAYLLYMK